MKSENARDIGITVTLPSKSCNDKRCPFHAGFGLRGRVFVGFVKSSKAAKTAIIEFQRLYHLKKYERFEKRRTRLYAHNPPCIDAKEGDKVRLMESRPISKTKHFVIIEKLQNESTKSKSN